MRISGSVRRDFSSGRVEGFFPIFFLRRSGLRVCFNHFNQAGTRLMQPSVTGGLPIGCFCFGLFFLWHERTSTAVVVVVVLVVFVLSLVESFPTRLPYPTLPYPTLPYPALPHRIVSYPFASYPLLSIDWTQCPRTAGWRLVVDAKGHFLALPSRMRGPGGGRRFPRPFPEPLVPSGVPGR